MRKKGYTVIYREEVLIEFFRSWCEGIIVAVMISIIIETILPEGNHKKYVKVVIGIYVIFTILNPILGKLNTNIDFSKQLDLATIETSTDVSTENIRDLYVGGIKETLKHKIEEEFGYQVNSITIAYDAKYENIEKITMSIQDSNVAQVEKIEIGNQQEAQAQTKKDYPDIRNYIAENYEVDKTKIIFQ